MRPFLSQLRTELALTSRQGEQILVSIGIPLLVLVFFSNVDILPSGPGDTPVDYLVPAVLALAVMSTSLVSLGIGTGFERHYGVLKRLGASPLGRRRWVAAKMVMVLIIEVVQWTVLMGVGLLLGWSPPSTGWIAAVAAGLLGTAAFAGLGLFLAGTLPGITTLALANGLYLVLLLIGGMVIPLSHLPAGLATISKLLPAAPLSEVLIGSFTGTSVPGWAWVSLTVWALVAPVAAAVMFRWE